MKLGHLVLPCLALIAAGRQAAAAPPATRPSADAGSAITAIDKPLIYSDNRPAAAWRLNATDAGPVLRYGDGPNACDAMGARDVWVWAHDGRYYMHYDAAGPRGWLSSLAVSDDLVHWTKKGPILDFGPPDADDSKAACYGVTYLEGGVWHLFYLGSPHAAAPNFVPSTPYLTLKAKGASAEGPWTKQPEVVPFRTKPGTYYSITASPGHVLRHGQEYVMLFSATTRLPGKKTIQRTLGIARTKDLDGVWTPDAAPILPSEEQIENSSLHFDPASGLWFLFTNHIGIRKSGREFTDAVWVYWSDSLDRWNPANKAIAFDGTNCTWNKECIGLPSVVPVGDKLAMFYDAPREGGTGHMRRDVGLAWIDLPIRVPGR